MYNFSLYAAMAAESLRAMASMDALVKILNRIARDAEIGRRKHDAACDKMNAMRNEYNMRRIQIENKELTLWWRRHRTCK